MAFSDIDCVCIGPSRSEWILSRGLVARGVEEDGKLRRCCLPCKHPSHGGADSVRLLIIWWSWILERAFQLRCPRRWCQISIGIPGCEAFNWGVELILIQK